MFLSLSSAGPLSRIGCLLLGLAACARDAATVDPYQFLRVGVDPVEEADALEGQFARAGRTRVARVDGRTFVALAFRDERTGESAVRVVTSRGSALALDAPYEGEVPVAALGLHVVPFDDHDLDGDGLEEVLIEVTDADRDRTCIAIVRVGEEGEAREVALDVGASAEHACIESVAPGESGPLAYLGVRRPGLALPEGDVPAVRVPLAGLRGRWRPAPPTSPAWLRLREVELASLDRARAARDVAAAYRHAVALAVLAHFAGEPGAVQVRIFDQSLAGLVLSPSEAAALGAARERIAAGWKAPPGTQVDP